METKEILGSRWKIGLYLAISLAFVAGGLWASPASGVNAWKMDFAVGFFGLGSLVFVWLLIRPQRLHLDPQGFTLSGGLVRTPHKVLWAEVDRFFVYRLPRGGKMVGYNFKPGVRKPSALRSITRGLGAEAALPKGWPQSPEQLAEELESCRRRAAGLSDLPVGLGA